MKYPPIIYKFILLLSMVFLGSCTENNIKETISIINAPLKLESKNSSMVSVAYEVKDKREIIVEIWKGDQLIANGVKVVSKGAEITQIELLTDEYPKEGEDFYYKAYIRSLGDELDTVINETIKEGLQIIGGEYYDSLPKSDYVEFERFERDSLNPNIFNFYIKYEASAEREISLITKYNGQWKGVKVKPVEAGVGVQKVDVKYEELPVKDDSFELPLWIRPRGTTWKEVTFGTTFRLVNDSKKGFYVKANQHANEIPEKESVKLVNKKDPISLSETSELKIQYATIEQREIDIIIQDANGNWLGGKTLNVRGGAGTIFTNVKLVNPAKKKDFCKVIVYIRPVKTTYKESITNDIIKVKFTK